VAVKCWELAPERFSWTNHPKFPNLDTARVSPSDAKKKKYGALVDGDNQSGWLLTSRGVDWARQNLQPHTDSATPPHLRIEEQRALAALTKHKMFLDWESGRSRAGLPEIADAVDLPADAPRRVIMRRIDSLGNAASLSHHKRAEKYLTWLIENLNS
jgi:hypothetical protein